MHASTLIKSDNHKSPVMPTDSILFTLSSNTLLPYTTCLTIQRCTATTKHSDLGAAAGLATIIIHFQHTHRVTKMGEYNLGQTPP